MDTQKPVVTQNPVVTQKPVVVVVDDDESLRQMICRALSTKYTVHDACDAPSALRLLETLAAPDLIICDVMMPVIDGLTLAKQVKATEALKRVPIVFLTARSGAMDVVAGINAGARSYIAKPFKIAALLERVAKIVGSPRP